ncbi:hypothetical protein TWF225_008911, partial [Orbilia oligospora]
MCQCLSLCGSGQEDMPDFRTRGLEWIFVGGLRSTSFLGRLMKNFIVSGWGNGYKFEKYGHVVYFNYEDPEGLVKELERRRLAGIIVWTKETSGGLGRLYLIGEDDMPLSIVQDAIWCAAVYPASQAGKVGLYVG